MSAAPALPVVDLHQHLWPESLLARLARRTAAPRLVRRRGGWILESHGEPDWPTDLRAHDPVWRADLARADGLDLALVAPSSPIGMESLPPDEAHALVEAYHDGVASLPAPFRGWAAACLRAPDPAALDRRLAEGFVGLCLPAGALSDPGGRSGWGRCSTFWSVAGRPCSCIPAPRRGPRRLPCPPARRPGGRR